ncbi:helix-turn-helix transcriptional regulator [Tabrizicola sp.]|uniref:helix-turn-helix domain-containing protein n=1 Tax=Tabrizicola sp. TaxID=2005166 RepID=UPI001A61AA56|nr:helix-turn-helix transcriptional regulator [Tabrizicola sp.]
MDGFARRLRERAEELGISNAEVARRCGLGERQYAYYTAGTREPNLQALVKISRILGSSSDELLGMADPPSRTERERLLDRLSLAATSLTDQELRTVVAQTEALASPRTKRISKKSPTF